MASFSGDYPYAYHVLPLHLWRSIVEAGALISKAQQPSSRPTTAAVDQALGFEDVVHLYLVKSSGSVPELPILQAQLRESEIPPFPHVVLELETEALEDNDCILCNWNLAVSRPSVPGVCKGGNWTRGTDPEKIRATWAAFRALRPKAVQARGYFKEKWAVPVLTGLSIKRNVQMLKTAPRGMPELMLPGRVPLDYFRRVLTFAPEDAALLDGVSPRPVQVESAVFPGYRTDLVSGETRAAIHAVLAGDLGADSAALDFDRIRPSA
jgi:hypothetical protein